MYPLNRNRRLRTSETLRNLIRESTITPNDFLVPLFVIEGKNNKREIQSMPNYFKMSIDLILKEIKILHSLGLKSVLLFAQVEESLKDNYGTEAINNNGLMQRAIRSIKDKFPDILVMSDVALDPYSSYGHDGVVENGLIVNDITNDILAKMSLSHIKAGADFVAPSDMMDGRVKVIRTMLEKEGCHNAGIMSYSAKYASSFYGPFRDALDSKPGFGDKKTYQMDIGNREEAINEVRLDIKEGADIVMVKPGISYLDIIRDIKNNFNIPISAYQVSGEYAMIKAASKNGWIDENQTILETSIAFKRAGASFIASYFAKDVIKLIS
ncbi:porphobilinogen synthase [Flavobacteriaceae bacterium]|nr:porphobilinogen synthase [Flavobacteriales bacterium]MDA8626134.1 porphobilinogen synthase [Flavobacteriaceae bacterium]MDA9550399.1 porphobilinogen synthase [Flavobacteriaceae bacterium]MDA9850313.1 porphobilinogen synthase [Flavobacteriaceae bacterium]MDB2599316.1 porphobilinogen synthase [Flavobacteriaceae bacterium]